MPSVWPLIPGSPISRAAQCRRQPPARTGISGWRIICLSPARTRGGAPDKPKRIFGGPIPSSHAGCLGRRLDRAQLSPMRPAQAGCSDHPGRDDHGALVPFCLRGRADSGGQGEPTGSPVVGSQSCAPPPVSVLATLKAWAGVVDWPPRPHSSFRQDLCGPESTMTQTDGSRRRRRSCSCRSSSSR
jgi:hypothetical protein